MVQPKFNGYNSKDMKLLQYQLNASVDFLKSVTETGISKDKNIQKAIDKNLLEAFIYINSIRLLTDIQILKSEEEAEFCKCHHALSDTLSNMPLTDNVRKESYTFALKCQQTIMGGF